MPKPPRDNNDCCVGNQGHNSQKTPRIILIAVSAGRVGGAWFCLTEQLQALPYTAQYESLWNYYYGL